MHMQLPLNGWLPLARFALLTLSVWVLPGNASEPSDPAQPVDRAVALSEIDPTVPLSKSDLRAITLEVMAAHPLLASSPGIKFAEARPFPRNGPAEAFANVIFHPHAETAGIKHAFEAHCRVSGGAWSCPHVELRRYVRLETQDFEVRVKGDLGLEAVLALVEATRDTLRSSTVEGAAALDTASMIIGGDDHYQVAWGDAEFQKTGVVVDARLRKDGDPTISTDWKTSIVPFEK
jgi:hypothetical protein